MKIAILGAAGRMGKMLCSLAEGAGCEVVAKVDIANGYDREWPKGTEGVIDFSFHAAVPAAISKAAEEGIPYVIGTTGLTADEQKVVDAAANGRPRSSATRAMPTRTRRSTSTRRRLSRRVRSFPSTWPPAAALLFASRGSFFKRRDAKAQRSRALFI